MVNASWFAPEIIQRQGKKLINLSVICAKFLRSEDEVDGWNRFISLQVTFRWKIVHLVQLIKIDLKLKPLVAWKNRLNFTIDDFEANKKYIHENVWVLLDFENTKIELNHEIEKSATNLVS